MKTLILFVLVFISVSTSAQYSKKRHNPVDNPVDKTGFIVAHCFLAGGFVTNECIIRDESLTIEQKNQQTLQVYGSAIVLTVVSYYTTIWIKEKLNKKKRSRKFKY